MALPPLKVKIGADTKDLDRGMSSAQKRVAAFAAVAVTAIAAVGAGMVAMTRRSLSNIDALTKQARSLGLTTAALQRMSMVANEAGVETGQLSAMLGLMQRNIIELGRGTAAQSDAFARLGLSMRDLQGLNPDEQFRRIAESLNTIEDPATRTATAMDIFGRSGRAAINMLEGYSDKVKEADDFQRRFNITVSEVDAAKIEQANDAWERVRSALSGVGNVLAAWVAPAIIKVSELMLTAIERVSGFGTAFRTIAQQVRLASLNMQAFFLSAIGKMAYEFTEFTWAVADGLNSLFGSNLMGMTAGPNGIPLTESIKTALIGVQDEAAAAREAIDIMQGRLSGPSDSPDLREGSGLLPPAPGSGEGDGEVTAIPSLGGGGAVTDQFASRLEALMAGLETEAEVLEEWRTQGLSDLEQAHMQGLLSEQQYLEARKRLEEEYASKSNAIERARMDNNKNAYVDGFGAILSAAGEGNKKLMKASKTFNAGMAFIDTMAGAAREMRKGTFGFASAAAVIAKGLGFVNAIKSVNDGGGGASLGGSGGSSSAGASQQQAAAPTTTFAFTLQNDPMGFGEGFARQIIDQLNEASRNGATVRGVLA